MTDVPSMSQFVAQPVAQQPPQVNLSSPVASAAQVFSSRFVAPTIPPPTWTQSLPAREPSTPEGPRSLTPAARSSTVAALAAGPSRQQEASFSASGSGSRSFPLIQKAETQTSREDSRVFTKTMPPRTGDVKVGRADVDSFAQGYSSYSSPVEFAS
eukprot:CAMPEP_0115050330 /NCGR_PEP_ID=MMETSP0227-20121206/1718_1 /TAXON_ID=89957 /ORGANISM="Polarella glacialis, Strain CCMP 1383" /LENGTH=155 /DNA_ID=CAMNT_0002434161 /DNA_START=383 /DNA_END=850 /DNA_ORIENTATION=-